MIISIKTRIIRTFMKKRAWLILGIHFKPLVKVERTTLLKLLRRLSSRSKKLMNLLILTLGSKIIHLKKSTRTRMWTLRIGPLQVSWIKVLRKPLLRKLLRGTIGKITHSIWWEVSFRETTSTKVFWVTTWLSRKPREVWILLMPYLPWVIRLGTRPLRANTNLMMNKVTNLWSSRSIRDIRRSISRFRHTKVLATQVPLLISSLLSHLTGRFWVLFQNLKNLRRI